MAILTKQYSVQQANNFCNILQQQNTSFFLWFGNIEPWPNDNSPPAPDFSFNTNEISLYDNIVFGQRIANTDVILMVSNNTWTANTVYAQFDPSDPEIFSKNFYVVTSANRIYKCIFNNYGAPSTIKPQQTTTTNQFALGDGYIWKYMTTIPSATKNKFSTNNYIPVVANSAVISHAIPGQVCAIQVTNTGSNYSCYNTGQLQNILNNNFLVLDANTNAVTGQYNNCSIYIRNSFGSDQISVIENYNHLTNTVKISPPLSLEYALELDNVVGTFSTRALLYQNLSFISIIDNVYPFNVGDFIVQTDTNAHGTVLAVNDGVLTVQVTTRFPFLNSDDPISVVGGPFTTQTGTLAGNSTSSIITGSGTTFTSLSATNTYINIFTNGFHYWRQVVSIQSDTQLTINKPFVTGNTTFSGLGFNTLTDVAQVLSVTNSLTAGNIIQSNLQGMELDFISPTGIFQLGETIYQGSANGICSYSNTSAVKVIQVNGTFTTGTISGMSSNITANCTSIEPDSTIYVTTSENNFILGLPITTNNNDSATLTAVEIEPSINANYIIGPQVIIEGDGSNFQAYAQVNSSSNTISNIVVVGLGQNYTNCNVSIINNPIYGSGATAVALLSPIKGHGSDIFNELGASVVGISTKVANSQIDNFYLPTTGQYRQFGILENPQFNDVTLTFSNVTSATLTSNVSNTFIIGESCIQIQSGAYGTITYNSSNTVQLQNISGTFTTSNASNSNTNLLGLISKATIPITGVTQGVFPLLASNQAIIQTDGGSGILVAANTTALTLTNVQGVFSTNTPFYDAYTNTYATCTGILVRNNSIISTLSKFTQVLRIPMTSNTGHFIAGETVTQLNGANNVTSGTVLSTNTDVDLIITTTGTFNVNEIVLQSPSGASGIVLSSNSTYMQVCNTNGTFITGQNITGQQSGSICSVTSVLTTLLLVATSGTWVNGANSKFIGSNSNATGVSGTANTIIFPDLVNNTGKNIYIENIQPVSRTANSAENLVLTIAF